MNSASAKRIDIISDTHGYLSPALWTSSRAQI